MIVIKRFFITLKTTALKNFLNKKIAVKYD